MEVLIGFLLAAILMGTLLTALFETSSLTTTLEKAHTDLLQRATMQQRLSSIFLQVLPKDIYTTIDENNHTALHVQFHNTIDINPHFCNILSATICIKNHQLTLVIYPNTSQQEPPIPPRQEILKKGVDHISYEFLDPNDLKRPLPNCWQQQHAHALAYIKMTLHLQNGLAEPYVFWVNHDSQGLSIL